MTGPIDFVAVLNSQVVSHGTSRKEESLWISYLVIASTKQLHVLLRLEPDWSSPGAASVSKIQV